MKDRDEIYGSNGCDDLRALTLRHKGATGAFLRTDLLIGVDADDQHVAEPFCAFEVAYMPDVQDVEAAVGEHDACAVLSGNRHARNQAVGLKYASRSICFL